MSLKYYSTNLKSEKVSFRDALLKGLAPDGGLFMPESIPQFTEQELSDMVNMEYHEIAFSVIHKFLKDEIPADVLKQLTREAYNYPVPLEKVTENKYLMRLDQGPTASFKDFAARMMGRLMQYFLKSENRKLTILTATSGDTGSAMANAFYKLDNIKVVVLFPETEVTVRQRKQMTSLGENVQILALNGKFDDCQALVKQAFNDPELSHLNLSSANSINIGRLLPQIVYYFYAYLKLAGQNKGEIIFSVPSGNFGDLMGGLLAKRMGLPVKKFVVATNDNDGVPKFFMSGRYDKIEPSRNCISSAMNVGHPSNLARLVALYGGIMDEKGNMSKEADLAAIRNDMYAVSINDAETREGIKEVYEKHKVIIEPHGAVGWKGLGHYLKETKDAFHPGVISVVLETAHPAKFPEQIQQVINVDPELPASLAGIESKPESINKIKTEYSDFKKYLLSQV